MELYGFSEIQSAVKSMKRESAKRNPIINADDVDGSSIPMLRAPINSSNPLNEIYRTGVHARCEPRCEGVRSKYKRFMPMWVKDRHMAFNKTSGQGKAESIQHLYSI